MTTTPTVVVRFRPPWEDIPERAAWVADRSRLTDPKSGETAQFQYLLSPSTTTRDAYNVVVKDTIQAALNGINIGLLAIGQSGAGKSFTLHGGRKAMGLISMTVEDLLRAMHESSAPDREYVASLSFVEMRNERVYDLLSEKSKPPEVQVIDRPDNRIKMQCLAEVPVLSLPDVNLNLHRANRKRHASSLALVRINVESRQNNQVVTSAMNILDFADGKDEIRLIAGALSGEKSKSLFGRIVTDTFANAKISLLCCCAPEPRHYVDSRTTLDFALLAQRSFLPIAEPNSSLIDENAEKMSTKGEAGKLPPEGDAGKLSPNSKDSSKRHSKRGSKQASDDAARFSPKSRRDNSFAILRPCTSQASVTSYSSDAASNEAKLNEMIRKLKEENMKLADDSEKKLNMLKQKLEHKNLELESMAQELSLKESTITILTERLKSLLEAKKTHEMAARDTRGQTLTSAINSSSCSPSPTVTCKSAASDSPSPPGTPPREIRQEPNMAFFKRSDRLEEEGMMCFPHDDCELRRHAEGKRANVSESSVSNRGDLLNSPGSANQDREISRARAFTVPEVSVEPKKAPVVRPKVKVSLAPSRNVSRPAKPKPISITSKSCEEVRLSTPPRAMNTPGASSSQNRRATDGKNVAAAKSKAAAASKATIQTPRYQSARVLTPRDTNGPASRSESGAGGDANPAPTGGVGTLAKIRALEQARNERRGQQEQVRREKDELIAAGEDPELIALERHIARWRAEKKFCLETPSWPVGKRIMIAVRKRPLCPIKESKCMDIVGGGKEAGASGSASTTVYVHEPQVGTQSLNKQLVLHRFPADAFFDDFCKNEDVFNGIGKPIVDKVVLDSGYGTIFAYGQTGSGKTHTMSGSVAFEGGADWEEIPGLVDLSAELLFESLGKTRPGSTVMMSYIELYNGRLFDLLNNRGEVKLLEDASGAMNIQGMSERSVGSKADVHRSLARGSRLRRTDAMTQNEHSSRSHSVLSLTVLNEQGQFAGRLSMVDLAGNERGTDNASASVKARRESAEINSSLLALKECLRSMASDRMFSPFRQSKLTLLLRDAFQCQNAMTAMIACLRAQSTASNYILDTLRYAERAMQVERAD